MTAAIPGERQRLDRACRYASEGPRSYPLGDGRDIVFVPMYKTLV